MPQAEVEAVAEGVESAVPPGTPRARRRASRGAAAEEAGAEDAPVRRAGARTPAGSGHGATSRTSDPRPDLRSHTDTAKAARPPGQRLRAHATREIDQALDALGWGGNRIHAGVHLARKNLRRARATLALGADGLGPGAALVDRELRDLNRDLSLLGDAHALSRPRPPAARRTRADARRLLARASRRRRRARAAALPRARTIPAWAGAALLRVLRAALRAMPWAQLQPEHWRAAVAASLQRVARAGERACASGGDEDWHDWRRRARRLSQQQRALKSAGLGADAPTFDKRQIERLGEAQDLNLLLDHCGKGSPFAKAERGALKAFARGELAGARERIQAGSEGRSPE
ncbi:CHAD domain-containing protein [Lysobacter enzymogenes]|nr:CHAD domain-containing protein [Lysobacter enzymogenes]QCW24566.1 CHAD domain-containing protein [Lysobacter enzymogenes]